MTARSRKSSIGYRPPIYDRLFNVARHLEERAITCESQVEAECLIEMMIAVEDTFGLVDDIHADCPTFS